MQLVICCSLILLLILCLRHSQMNDLFLLVHAHKGITFEPLSVVLFNGSSTCDVRLVCCCLLYWSLCKHQSPWRFLLKLFESVIYLARNALTVSLLHSYSKHVQSSTLGTRSDLIRRLDEFVHEGWHLTLLLLFLNLKVFPLLVCPLDVLAEVWRINCVDYVQQVLTIGNSWFSQVW